jgi:phage repressor protein C with HTH and peptisase S24 domain
VRRLFLIRRVVGGSMLPNLHHGRIVLGWGLPRRLRMGDIVILSHDGLEKIKRISHIDGEKLYVRGDNAPESTDSRQFGWVDRAHVIALVIWPRLY